MLPEDDLSLASVLKSPLIGLTEEQLFTLAANRNGSLYNSLYQRSDHPEFGRALELLNRWQARADQLPVYEFYALILGADRGRHTKRQNPGAAAQAEIGEGRAVVDQWKGEQTGRSAPRRMRSRGSDCSAGRRR